MQRQWLGLASLVRDIVLVLPATSSDDLSPRAHTVLWSFFEIKCLPVDNFCLTGGRGCAYNLSMKISKDDSLRVVPAGWTCRQCSRFVNEPPHRSHLCFACSSQNIINAINQLRSGRGVVYDRWLRGIHSAVDGLAVKRVRNSKK